MAESRQELEKRTLQRDLVRHSEDGSFETTSGIEMERLYTPLDVQTDYQHDLGFPGQYPFTRGIYPNMYRGRLWTMRQYAGYAGAQETNRRFKYLLEQGQTGLSVAFDLPTQLGYDSDHPLAHGEVGRVGVAVSSLKDLEGLFDGIRLTKVSTSMTINSTAPILLAMYVALAKRQGADLNALRGTVQNDILKEYVARGTYIFPPGPSMRLVVDILAYCQEQLPHWNAISISGYHMREAGADAVQEVAFTLAHAMAYVRAGMARGLDVDEFAPRLSFFFSAHNDFLEEIAKFRAARRLWANIMRGRFKAQNPQSWMLRFHTQTAGSTLTAQQPHNNLARVTVQALAAVLGGTQSLHTNSMDEALALPTEEAVAIALRTQQIIAHESGVTQTVDPLGGSYCLEKLTDELETRAEEYIHHIEEMGGAVAAVEKGFMQQEIARSAYRQQKEAEAGRRAVVGVNCYQTPERETFGLLRVKPEIQEQQIGRLKNLRAERDSAKVETVLAELTEAARGEENLMHSIVECVEAGATLGEIAQALRQIFGGYSAPDIF